LAQIAAWILTWLLARGLTLIVAYLRARSRTRLFAHLLAWRLARIVARRRTWIRTRLEARLLTDLLVNLLNLFANLLARTRVAPRRRRIAGQVHRLDAAGEHRAADRPHDAALAADRRRGCVARRLALAPEPSE
jgi:hypothetical protein